MSKIDMPNVSHKMSILAKIRQKIICLIAGEMTVALNLQVIPYPKYFFTADGEKDGALIKNVYFNHAGITPNNKRGNDYSSIANDPDRLSLNKEEILSKINQGD